MGKERRERERVEINSTRICLDRLSGSALCGEHFEVLSDAEVESAGISWDVSLCVPASPLVVTVFSRMRMWCVALFFFLIRSVTFLSRRLLYLQKTRSECGCGV